MPAQPPADNYLTEEIKQALRETGVDDFVDNPQSRLDRIMQEIQDSIVGMSEEELREEFDFDLSLEYNMESFIFKDENKRTRKLLMDTLSKWKAEQKKNLDEQPSDAYDSPG